MEKKLQYDDLYENEKLALRIAIAYPYGGTGEALKKLNVVTKNGEPNYNQRAKGEKNLIERGLIHVRKDHQTVVSSSAFELLSREEAIELLQLSIANSSECINSLREENKAVKLTLVELQKRMATNMEIGNRLKNIEDMVAKLSCQ